MKISEAISKLRRGLKETRPQFADRLGVRVGAIARWEGNGDRPSAAMLSALSALANEQHMPDCAEALEGAQVRRSQMYLKDLAEHAYHLVGQVESYFLEYTATATPDTERPYVGRRLLETTKALKDHIGNPVLNPFFKARVEGLVEVEE